MQTVNRRVRPSITCRGGQAVRKNGKSGRAPDTGKDVMRTAPAQMVNASDVWEDAGASSGICAPQLAEQRVQARAARCEPLWIFSRSARSKRYPRSVLTLKSARGCKQKSAIRQLVLGAGVALEIDVWFEFCCSEANVADWPHDWPSRGLLQFAADPGGEGG